MKLLIQQEDTYTSRNIQEKELDQIIEEVVTYYNAQLVPCLSHELFRWRIPKGIIIIFKDNRKLRTRNYWFEVRGLAALARQEGRSFQHAITIKFPNGQETEIDGRDVESMNTMVELKQTTITQDWIKFFSKKRDALNFNECIVIASGFAPGLQIPDKMRLFEFHLDTAALQDYYLNQFTLPEWFESFITPRHVRILLSNGNWHGINRKLTFTAKHTPCSKIVLDLNHLFQNKQYPIRIYYSLARMVMPQRDYHGKGYPIPRLIAAFDIDSDHKPHIIGKEGFCKACMDDANVKCKVISTKLADLGFHTRILHSGFKGYHVYCINEDSTPIEFSTQQMQDLLDTLVDANGKPLTDNANFKGKDGSFDLHRIFKLPNTIDAVTGIRVIEGFERLRFNDIIFQRKME